MKKFIVFILVFLFVVISCNKREETTNVKESSTDNQSNNESISNSEGTTEKEWVMESGMGWSLSLRSDNTFSSMFHGPGGSEFSGTWNKEGSQLLLKPNPEQAAYISLWGDGKFPKSGVYKCKEKDDNTSLFYTRKLDCGVENFWDPNSKRKGGPAKYKGIDIELINNDKYGVSTTAVKFRSAPNAEAKVYSCFLMDKKVGSIPEGMEFNVIGRTKDKVKVGKWENYWYLIETIFDEGFHCESDRGWVFAEFVKFQDLE